ncbi:MAG: helix-turn-helix domain-containing protein [bacterium]
METANLTQELIKIGLSEKEAQVYLANLELGQSSVQEIAKKSGVNRTTTYVILNALIKKGLASTYSKDKKIFYVAGDPESLERIFTNRKKEIEEQQRYFKNVVEELDLINNKQLDKPAVRFFEGEQGLLSCASLIFEGYDQKEKDVMRMIYPKDRLKEVLNINDKQKFRNSRLDKKVKSKVLCTSSEEVGGTPDGDRIRIDAKDFPVTSDIAIYGDNVRIASLGKKLSAILIKDKEIANTLKSLFDLAWESAKARQDKKK